MIAIDCIEHLSRHDTRQLTSVVRSVRRIEGNV